MGETLDIDALYAASYRRLVVQMYALCGDLADAEDAVQEAFVTAIRKQRSVAAVDNPEAWLRTVAVNRIRGGWRHALVVRRYEVKVPGPQAEVEVGPSTSPSSARSPTSTTSSGTSWSCTTSPTSASGRSPPSSASPRAP